MCWRSDKSTFLGFDRRGWLWVGTDHGVDVFDHVRWRHFGRADGLIWDDCNSNAFWPPKTDRSGSAPAGVCRDSSRSRFRRPAFRPKLYSPP